MREILIQIAIIAIIIIIILTTLAILIKTRNMKKILHFKDRARKKFNHYNNNKKNKKYKILISSKNSVKVKI